MTISTPPSYDFEGSGSILSLHDSTSEIRKNEPSTDRDASLVQIANDEGFLLASSFSPPVSILTSSGTAFSIGNDTAKINVSSLNNSDHGESVVIETETSTFFAPSKVIPLVIILGMLILITLIGNLLLMVAILSQRSLRRAVFNRTIVSIAVTGVLVSIFVMPISLLNEISSVWFLGDFLCTVFTVLDVTFCTASIFHLVAIAIDRYLSATRIHYFRQRRKWINWMLVGAWVGAGLLSLLPVMGWRDPELASSKTGQCLVSGDPTFAIFGTAIAFYLPTLCIIAIYIRIYVEVHRRIRRHLILLRPLTELRLSIMKQRMRTSHTLPCKEAFAGVGSEAEVPRASSFTGLSTFAQGATRNGGSALAVTSSSPIIDARKSPVFIGKNHVDHKRHSASTLTAVTATQAIGTIMLQSNNKNSNNEVAGTSKNEPAEFSYKNNGECLLKKSPPNNGLLEDETNQAELLNQTAVVGKELVANFRKKAKLRRIHGGWLSRSAATPLQRITVAQALLAVATDGLNNFEEKTGEQGVQRGDSSGSSNNNNFNSKKLTARSPLAPDETISLEAGSDENNEITRQASTTAGTVDRPFMWKQRERRMAATSLTVTLAFIVCWLPYFAMELIIPLFGFYDFLPAHPLFRTTINWFGYCNSLLNPIIFCLTSAEFRIAFKALLKR